MLRTVTAGWLLLAAVLARADDPPKQPPTPAEQLQALKREYDEAMSAYRKAATTAKTDEERQKAFEEKYPKPEAFAARFLELAEKNSTDPTALEALQWVVERSRGGEPGNPAGKALAVLKRDHAASPKIGPVCTALTYSYDAGTVPFLRAVLEKNPNREAQGAACLTLARVLKSRAELAKRFREKPTEAQRLESFLGKELVAELKTAAPDKIIAESEQLFERVVKEYADLKSGRGTYATAAEGELFELRFLAIGKVAPEVTGEDIEGQPLRLSDFRGKVVVLDFWGHW
jgi:AhpC/TSA family